MEDRREEESPALNAHASQTSASAASNVPAEERPKVGSSSAVSLALTEEEQRVLEFEQNFSGTRHRKEAQIRAMGMSVVHYYLTLERLLANPVVEDAHPHFVRTRRRALERRLRERVVHYGEQGLNAHT